MRHSSPLYAMGYEVVTRVDAWSFFSLPGTSCACFARTDHTVSLVTVAEACERPNGWVFDCTERTTTFHFRRHGAPKHPGACRESLGGAVSVRFVARLWQLVDAPPHAGFRSQPSIFFWSWQRRGLNDIWCLLRHVERTCLLSVTPALPSEVIGATCAGCDLLRRFVSVEREDHPVAVIIFGFSPLR